MNYRYLSKRVLVRLGFTDTLWNNREDGLYCFNFHRIGNSLGTKFDPGVYSCTSDELRQYLEFIKGEFRVIDLAELNQLIESGEKVAERLAFFTFDDGYRDNFELALPLLKELDIPATFYITTSLIESGAIPWWDEIAWYVKQCAGKTLQLSPWNTQITIPSKVTREIIKVVLQQVKLHGDQLENQVAELRQVIEAEPDTGDLTNLFMSWDNLRALQEAGMTIGAHSHSHKILSHLSEVELHFELQHSKDILETELATKISTLSYPVGNAATYNSSMFEMIEMLGYKTAFSFRSYINQNVADFHLELGRFSIDRPFDEDYLKSMCLLATVR